MGKLKNVMTFCPLTSFVFQIVANFIKQRSGMFRSYSDMNQHLSIVCFHVSLLCTVQYETAVSCGTPYRALSAVENIIIATHKQHRRMKSSSKEFASNVSETL